MSLAGGSSYSKTDTDATFMGSKDDHLGNGQLKASYNVQIGTNKPYVLHYSVHQQPTDMTTLPGQIAAYEASYGQLPAALVADAGYSWTANYALLASKSVVSYIKEQGYEQAKKKSWAKPYPFAVSTLDYNREEDAYYCPKGQQMGCIGQHKERSSTGYASTVKRYEGQNGSSCPLRGVCHKSKGKRVVKVNELLNGYKKAFQEGLSTQEGIELYKRRGREVETVFGVVKQHMGFRRFYLRRKEKVELEVGLLWLSYTLKQWAKSIQKRTPRRATDSSLKGQVCPQRLS